MKDHVIHRIHHNQWGSIADDVVAEKGFFCFFGAFGNLRVQALREIRIFEAGLGFR